VTGTRDGTHCETSEQNGGSAMAIGILAAVLGLLLSTAAIFIPRIVARHNRPEDHADSLAYLADTGRSAQDIIQANRGSPARTDSDAGPGQEDSADPG
jgi:hypothetical protein